MNSLVKSQKITLTVQMSPWLWAAVNKCSSIYFCISAALHSQNCASLNLTALLCDMWLNVLSFDAYSLNDIEIAMRISGITVVSSFTIPKTVPLSSLQFQVSCNTSLYYIESCQWWTLYFDILIQYTHFVGPGIARIGPFCFQSRLEAAGCHTGRPKLKFYVYFVLQCL